MRGIVSTGRHRRRRVILTTLASGALACSLECSPSASLSPFPYSAGALVVVGEVKTTDAVILVRHGRLPSNTLERNVVRRTLNRSARRHIISEP